MKDKNTSYDYEIINMHAENSYERSKNFQERGYEVYSLNGNTLVLRKQVSEDEMVSIKDKKAEALKRIELLQLHPNVIKEFTVYGKVNYSENDGYLYWLSNKPEWETFVKEFEKRYKALVYHAEFSRFSFGNCLSLFYVSNHKEEWVRDQKDLKDGYAVCYIWNMDDHTCSEFGTIAFKRVNGGVKRTN